jgi:large subunit ribosomal protein L25
VSTIVLQAEARKEVGKSATRRLRRLENKVPAIVYGGSKKPQSIHLAHNKVTKALENQSIYSTVFDLHVDNKVEQVILKALQRHPYKSLILHMDLQRVSGKDVLVKAIPIHFINEEVAKGAKAGGIITHNMNQVEVRCQVKNLPEFIEVNMADVDLNDIVHLSDLQLPKGVELTVDLKDASYDLAVASIHPPKVAPVEEEVTLEAAAEEVEAKEEEKEEQADKEEKGAE